jgi:hypothetical protein
MTVLKKLILASALSLGLASAAHATLLPGTYITTLTPYSHTFTYQQPQNTTIDWATLSLYLSDPVDLLPWTSTREALSVKADGVLLHTITNVSGSGSLYAIGLAPSLLADGKLAVSLSLGCNKGLFGTCALQDVWLNSMNLTLGLSPVAPTPAEVPEPASLLILGAGLAGLLAARRRA